MQNYFDSIREQVALVISEIAEVKTLISIPEICKMLVEPPQSELGDLAFGCFILAKNLKKSPAQVAQSLQESLLVNSTSWNQLFIKIEAAGPYLNFTLKSEIVGQTLLSDIISGDHFLKPAQYLKSKNINQKIMIEYSQPNTHKELHVGHMRNACLGNAVVRIMRYAGEDVISSTFPGDVGTHVAKCLWYMKFHNKESVPETGRGEWLGSLYSKGNLKLEDEEKDPVLYEENKKKLTEILKQLESKSGEFYELWKQTREWSIDLMSETYKWAGIQFDRWYWESEVDSVSVEYVKKLYADGKLVESQGAIGMDLEAEKLGFCLLLKSDGTGLYATKDLELARRKFQDFNIQKSIYVVDMRQALHFKQVFKVLENLGFAQAKDCFHLQYNFVELPDGAMSSRKGNIVPLMKLVKNMEQMVKEKYLSRYQNEWSVEEINLVASQVAQGAIKYGMVKIDNNKKIVFDLDEWLKIDGESGPFIQYSVARINSLCKKMNFDQINAKVLNWSVLNHSSERKLFQALMNFNTVVLQASETYRPSVLCTYLFELSKRFNLFYHDCSIGQAETEELKQARLALSFCAGAVLKKGLEVLGIPSPERM
jgi:arginyl-tRNA synthetase